MALSILHERIAHPHPGRYWWTVEDDRVSGFAFRTPLTFMAGVTPMSVGAVHALVERMADDIPDLSGMYSEAATAATFAGRWTERRRVGAEPVEGQRLYWLDAVNEVPRPTGTMRVVTGDEHDLMVRWMEAFHAETGAGGGTLELEDTIRRRTHDGMLWIWDDDGIAATAMAVPSTAGAVRVGFVYTDPGRRGRGYAQALVATLSRQALDAGATACLLYTQLSNPTSNSIYRRVGYRAVSEITRYDFRP